MRYLLVICCYFLTFNAGAVTIDNYRFSQLSQEKRFHDLIADLRCLVCQNQNLADSNAPLAKDLRNEVYRQIINGTNDADIKKYLVARYGNYVLFKPPMNKATYILWLAPFSFLIIGALALCKTIARNKKG